MKLFNRILPIVFILNFATCFSQNDFMNTDINKIKKLNRDSIIQLGFSMVQKTAGSNITLKSFDKITVFANKKSVIVSFFNPIKYVPSNSVYYYDISVDIIQKTSSYGPVSNPREYGSGKQNISFFVPTAESEKKILFVINAVNKNESAIAGNKKSFLEKMDGSMIIRDYPDYYEIERVSEYNESWYKINKISGKIVDEGHAELIPPPKDENNKDEFIEIKK